MALSDLRVSGLEHYGGIELKKNYRKFFSEGIVVSIGLHVLVLLLYVTYNFLTVQPSYIYPAWRTINMLVTMPPPSLVDDGALPPPSAVRTRLPQPNDIPVPVPKLIEQVQVEPLLQPSGIQSQAATQVGSQSSPGYDPAPGVVSSDPRPGSEIPEKGIWTEYSDEARPVQDIQSLVQYPTHAQQTNIEGKVTFSALIGEDGRVLKVEIETGSHPWLEQAAIEAMVKARFTPAKQGTVAVKSWYTQTIVFKLRN